VKTNYIQTAEHKAWTFEDTQIRKWVLENISGRVLNACCGKSKLPHDNDILRNDLDENIDADTHVDVAELPTCYERESFDTILFDPPWTMYQANMRYDGRHVTKGDIEIDASELPQVIGREKSQVGHARLAKDGFDYLLKPGGKVIQLAYSGTCMPSRLQYKRVERTMFDPLGEGKTLIGSVDVKQQTSLGGNA
jgi:hypothetical protein